MIELKEFFFHTIKEGPRDPAFKPAPEVEAEPGAGADAMPPAGPGLDAGMGGDMPPADLAGMTQDVSAMSASSLQFFSKNVQSAVSKYDLEADGFDTSALMAFAGALDQMALQVYQQVQEPEARQAFEADYQKLAADWSKDLTKLFGAVMKLKSHTAQY